MGERRLSLRSAVWLPIMTSVCSASNGEQAVARDLRHATVDKRIVTSRYGTKSRDRGTTVIQFTGIVISK